MIFSFKTARKDLMRSLTKARAHNVLYALAEMENLIEQYYLSFITDGIFPDMKFTGEARQLFAHADAVCHAFEDISPPTRARLEDELLERDEKLSLDEYAQLVNDVCGFAVHAMGYSDRPLKVSESSADRALCR